MDHDPLGFFAAESRPAKDANKASFPAPSIAAADDELKKVDFDKYAVKGGAKTTLKVEKKVEPTGVSQGYVNSSNRGLGFGDTVSSTAFNFDDPTESKRSGAKLNAAFDVLEQAALKDQQSDASSALDDSLFGTSAAPAPARAAAAPARVATKGVRMRDLNESEDNKIHDLKLSAAVLEKEDDATLAFDVFGRSAIDASGNIIKPAAPDTSVEDRRAINEASSELSELDLLAEHAHIESEDNIRKKKMESAAAAAAALSSSATFKKQETPAVDIDMATLDLDAYMAANSGDSGGGLFD